MPPTPPDADLPASAIASVTVFAAAPTVVGAVVAAAPTVVGVALGFQQPRRLLAVPIRRFGSPVCPR